jgi:hypothetical protein
VLGQVLVHFHEEIDSKWRKKEEELPKLEKNEDSFQTNITKWPDLEAELRN